MTTVKHTPGPWLFNSEDLKKAKPGVLEPVVRSLSGEEVACISLRFGIDEFERNNMVEYEANAQLIATAPELLDSLEIATEELRAHGADPKLVSRLLNTIKKATLGA